MKPNRLFPSLLLAAAMALLLLTAARAEDPVGSIRFSDPSRPGTVKIQIGRGNVRVRGGDAPEVTVKSDARPATKATRKDGLRVLTSSSSYALSEKDNVITLDAISDGWHGGGADFTLTVPRTSNVIVSNSWGGDVSCGQISGDIEIKSLNGEVRLEGISGAALVETMNGEIRATVAELRDNKPLSFTSMNGEIVLRVPPAAKANVRIRTQNGSVLTDFEESALATRTETSPRGMSRTSHEVLPAQAREAIREAARAGAEAVRDAAAALQEAASAAKEGAEAAQRDSDTPPPRPPAAPKAPRAPRVPTIPTITGGKLITGTLNGGGPEISISTMNGDVTLRQLTDAK
jgi:hypothetical protein